MYLPLCREQSLPRSSGFPNWCRGRNRSPEPPKRVGGEFQIEGQRLFHSLSVQPSDSQLDLEEKRFGLSHKGSAVQGRDHLLLLLDSCTEDWHWIIVTHSGFTVIVVPKQGTYCSSSTLYTYSVNSSHSQFWPFPADSPCELGAKRLIGTRCGLNTWKPTSQAVIVGPVNVGQRIS